MKNLMTKIFGTKHGREAKRLAPLVDETNRQFATLEALSEDELKAKTDEFRRRNSRRYPAEE